MKGFSNSLFTVCVVCMVVLCGTVINCYAQETPADVQLPETVPGTDVPSQELSSIQKETQTQAVKSETQVVKKTEPVADIKKEEKKPTVTASNDATQTTDAAKVFKVDSKSLLSITDGAFRYSRIPGITIKENNEEIIAKLEEDTQNTQNSDTDKKGLFGLSKQASDRMAKIILVVIIVFVFILYRMRTRSTSGSVLRRFPK